MFIFFMAVLLLMISRIAELRTSTAHEKLICKHQGAVLLQKGEYEQIVFFHSIWFAALIAEGLWRKTLAPWPLDILFLLLLLIAQAIRWWSIRSLGMYWTAKIYRCNPHHPLITAGPYRWLMHPSYLAVLIEFIFFPWLFSCYWTIVFFVPIKILLLVRRLKLEHKILKRYI